MLLLREASGMVKSTQGNITQGANLPTAAGFLGEFWSTVRYDDLTHTPRHADLSFLTLIGLRHAADEIAHVNFSPEGTRDTLSLREAMSRKIDRMVSLSAGCMAA
jgi:hypothetical protein